MDAPPPVRRPLSEALSPNWRQESAYHALFGADPCAFAWEWLRRTPAYKAAWETYGRDRGGVRAARRFGLVSLEDPAAAVPTARPVWSRVILPDVLTAHVENIAAPRSERIDLRRLAPLVTIVIGSDETEHLLFSDGRRFLRIDVVEGTLIGCPSSLSYLLTGLTRLAGPIASLNRLARLVRAGSFDQERSAALMRHHRWVAELRVADALASGNDQQSIARAMFGELIADRRWRVENASYRRKVQRLVGEARAKLLAPSETWFRS